MMCTQTDISVLVITFNESDRIKKCLVSVQWADEIIVVDSFSTDDTVDIARQCRAEVFQKSWLGFSAQRNYGLALCHGKWVLILDADEIILPELAEEIKAIIREDNLDFAGYWIKRRYYFLGKWVRHAGTYPDLALRFFRRGKGYYNKRLVHEGLELDGRTAVLQHDILHESCRSISHYLSKNCHYSRLAAEELFRQNKQADLRHILLHSCWCFFKKYVWEKGFLDGIRGLIVSLMSAHYVAYKYMILWELNRKGFADEKNTGN